MGVRYVPGAEVDIRERPLIASCPIRTRAKRNEGQGDGGHQDSCKAAGTFAGTRPYQCVDASDPDIGEQRRRQGCYRRQPWGAGSR